MNRVAYRALIFVPLVFGWGTLAIGQAPSLSEIVGGRGGIGFSDAEIPSGGRVLEVHIRSGDHVDSVQMTYSLPDGRVVTGPRHGGSGGELNIFRLDSDEYITGISGRYGDYIDSIQIHTNKRTSPIFGGRGGNRDFRIEISSGNQAVGFTGRAGDYLDAVGLTFVPVYLEEVRPTAISGGRGGSLFSDRDIPQGARLTEVRIRVGDRIDSIQAVYVLANGSSLEGEVHGGRGGRSRIFRLDADEYIIGLSGRYGDNIDSLRVHTNKRTSELFGGRGGDNDFRIEVPAGNQAIGFSGRAGDYIDAIGLNYMPATLRKYQRGRRVTPFDRR